MDSVPFDQYSSYSDSSTPRTPSPREEMHYQHSSPYTSKSQLELDPFRHIQEPESQHHGEFWTGIHSGAPFTFHPSKGSLLQELYEDPEESREQQQQHSHSHSSREYSNQSAEPSSYGGSQWSHPQPPQHQQQQQQHQYSRSSANADYTMTRRATFPYVRQDREENHYPTTSPQPFLPPDNHYRSESSSYQQQHPDRSPHAHHLPMSAEPSAFHGEYLSSSPHGSYREFGSPGHDDRNVKLEDSSSPRVPPQPFYRGPPSPPAQIMSHMSPYAGIVVQHTDDAASKETQYLRRRCFNCHTTEPPSWRRSTLNPGKIVCNKCGLYERTHLRPRPLRFDELRAGNKARKNSAKASPKAGKAGIKKDSARGEYGIARRSSVSSTHSNTSSASGVSDWDESVSIYSSGGSAPPSSFNSPSMTSYPMPRDRSSQSPPMTAQDQRRRGMSDASGIRLPNAPLTDIASMHGPSKPLHVSQPPPPSPRKGGDNYYSGPQPPNYFRRDSMPDMRMDPQRRGSDLPLGESGWQAVDMPTRTEVAV